MIIPDIDQHSSFNKDMMGSFTGIDMDRLTYRLSKNIIGSVKANPRSSRPRGVVDIVQEAEALLTVIESDQASVKKRSSKSTPLVSSAVEVTRDAPRKVELQHSTPPARLSVVFDQIIVREYPRIVGANTRPSGGPSITMDWTYTELPPLSVDDFESIRTGRRHGKDLLIGKTRREKIAARLAVESDLAGKLRSSRDSKPSIKSRLKSILAIQHP